MVGFSNFSKYEAYVKLKNKSKEVGFDTHSHTYRYMDRTLSPVTSLVSRFFPRFDARKVSEGLARKELGASADFAVVSEHARALRESWKLKAELGTRFHELAELFLLSGADDLFSKPSSVFSEDLQVCSWLDGLRSFLYDYPRVLGELLVTEFVLWSSTYNVSGQADFITINSDGSLDVWDWKTSTSIVAEGVDFGKFGFGGLAKLPDTNFYHYSLQLGIYAKILEDWGFRVRDLYVVHIKPGAYKVYSLPRLTDEVNYVLLNNK